MKRLLLPLLLLAGILALADTASAQLRRNRGTPAPAFVPAPFTEAAPPAAAATAPAITEGHRLLYDAARGRAAGQLARKKNISRAEAREMIDDAAPDEVLHVLAAKAGLKFKGLPQAGGLSGFLDWLIAHADQIMALVKIIMALFGVDAETGEVVSLDTAWVLVA